MFSVDMVMDNKIYSIDDATFEENIEEIDSYFEEADEK